MKKKLQPIFIFLFLLSFNLKAQTPVQAPVITYASPQSYVAGTAIAPLLPVKTGGAVPAGYYAQTSTVKAGFGYIYCVVTDMAGNIYFGDSDNHVIRKITPTGLISMFAGSGAPGTANGTGTAASFSTIRGLAIDALGNIYVADADNNLIRKINPYGVVTTFAGNGIAGAVNGAAANATFNYPSGVAIDAAGNVFVTENYNNDIRKITAAGIVSTLAGNVDGGYLDGQGAAASFNVPQGIAIDATGNLYISDTNNFLIRKVTAAGVVTTFAGAAGDPGLDDGTDAAARFYYPQGIAIDAAGNLYVADSRNFLIRKITPAKQVITIAGSASGSIDGVGASATFSDPEGLAIDKSGNLYVADYSAVRKISLAGYSAPVLPPGLAFDPNTGSITGTPLLTKPATTYSVTAYNTGGNSTANFSITVTGTITPPVNPVAAPHITYATPQSYVAGTAITPLKPANSGGAVPGGYYGQVVTLATGFGDSRAIVTDAAQNIYYGDNNLIRKVTLAGVSSIFAGSTNAGSSDGTGTAARFNGIQGLAMDASGNIFVTDANNNVLRKVTAAGVVTTFAGSGIKGRNDGIGTDASFDTPANIVIDRYGNIFLADFSNNTIRKITPAGIVSTFAGNGLQNSTDGTGTGASFFHPQGITIDGLGNLYVAETENSVIRKITPAGVVTTFAGTPGNPGFVNGTGTGASFSYPSSLSADLSGNIFVADFYNYAVRKITPAGVVTTVAGGNSSTIDGTGTLAGFGSPQALVVDGLGNLLVSDGGSIRKVSVTGYVAPTLPAGLTFDPSNGSISGSPLVAKAAASYSITAYNTGGSNTAIVSIAVTGTITPPVNPLAAPHIAYATPQSYVAGVAINSLTPTNSGGAVPAGFYGQTSTLVNSLGTATAIVTDAAQNIYYGESYLIRKITPAGVSSIFAGSGNPGSANGSGTAASFNGIQGLAIDAAGNIYATERANNLVRKITPAGVVTTLAGSGSAGRNDGAGATASFNGPASIVADAYGNLYLSDFYNNLVRKITPAGVVTTFAGSGAPVTVDGTGTDASFIHPQGMAIDGAGNLYVSEPENSVIRKITTAGAVSTFAGSAGTTGFSNGTGTAASFYNPAGLSADIAGNIYVADTYNYVVRKITPAAVVTTLAGGNSSSADGLGTAAGFSGPQGITADGLGNVFVTDNGAIRKILVTGYVMNPVLPAGLTLDPATGSISGTPLLAKAATSYAITAYNTGGSNTATVSIAVTGTPAAPAAISAPVISYAGPKTYPTGAAIASLAPTNTGGAVPATIYGQSSTFAGSGVTGQTDGSSAAATFNNLSAVAADVYGNTYIADRGNHVIRKISANGIVTTFAGSGTAGYADGTGSAAGFYSPSGIAVDVLGNVYVTDTYNQVIRKITPAGVVTTLAGTAGNIGSANGTGANAAFNYPTGITIDASKNLYITDENNYTIRKITSAGVVTTIAGSAGSAGSDNGTGAAATFNAPSGIAVDASGNLYVADFGNSLIRKVTSAGVVTTFAGGTAGFVDGTGAAAGFYNPKGITIDKAGNLYVTDAGNNLIRKITSAKVVSTLAGNTLPDLVNGIGTASSFNNPWGIAIDVKGNIYIVDANNNVVRKITATGYTIDNSLPAGLTFNSATGIISGTPTAPLAAAVYTITAYNGGGSGSAAVTITATGNAVAKTLISPPQISYGAAKSYVAGTAIAALTPTNTGGAVPPAIYGQTTTFNAPIGYSTGLATDGAGNTYISSNNQVIKVNAAGVGSIFAGNTIVGSANGKGTAASFNDAEGLAVDASGNLYVADAGNNQIRKITPSGVVTTYAGNLTAGTTNGSLTAARFNSPVGLAFDASGNLYVADVNNYLIRKITAAGVVSTFAGSGAYGYADGSGSAASFSNVYGMVTDASGNVYLTDRGNQVVRKITPAGLVSTLAGTAGNAGAVDGTGSAASFYNPYGLAIDAGSNLYVADQANMLVRKITPAGVVTTLAGNGTGATVDGVGTNASFYNPSLIAADGSGNLYVTEYYNNILRKISITGYKLDGTLPAGLTFDGTTGTISGTPLLKIAATNYSVTAYNAGGSSTTSVNIAVTGTIVPPVNPVQAPVITYATPKSYIAGTAITPLLPANTGGAVPASIYGQTSTIASGLYSDNLVADASGNIYTTSNNKVIKISPSGVSNVLAGNGTAGFTNGTGTAASFNNPQGLAIDAAGNIYVADYGNNSIRKITSAGVVTTLAGNGSTGRVDGSGAISSFNGPQGVAVDKYGNVFITEVGNNLVRKINSSGLVTTLAGSGSGGYTDGNGSAASFSNPNGIVSDASGNLYVTDENNALIRKITPDGVVSTFAGTANSTGAVNGAGTAASFSNPSGISIDAAGNLYVADQHNMLIRKITPAAVVTTLAGTGLQATVDGTATDASFYYPSGVTADGLGNVYVNDPYYGNVRKISIAGYSIKGTLPAGLTFDGTTGAISGTPLLAVAASSYTVTAYNAGGSSAAALSIAVTGAITPPVNPVQAPVISYATPQSYAAGVNITALMPTNTGGAVPAATYGQTSTISKSLPYITGITVDAAGNIYGSGDNQIFKITPAGVASVFAGSSTLGTANGTGTAARFNNPQGLAIDAAGNIYVADYNNNQVRKITPAGVVTTLAGNGPAGRVDGPAAFANFFAPQGLAADNYGNIYVTENGNNLVRKISSSGLVSTIAGSGSAGNADGTGAAASFSNPFGIAADGSGNLYVADQGNQVIRKITAAGVVTTFAGTAGNTGANNGTGAAAAFNAPSGLAIDAGGNLYVADQNNLLIRKITPARVVTTLAGNGTPYPADGVGTSSSFYYPSVIAADVSGSVYVNDYYNNSIRKISITGYSLTGTLPAGLTFDSTTGTVSGTPLLAAAAKSYSITAYNAGGSGTAALSIAVTGTAVAPTLATLPVISYATPKTYGVGVPIAPLQPANTGGAVPAGTYGLSSTLAGSGATGRADGSGVMASFSGMSGTATDIYGNVYVADNVNNIIRKITPGGIVTTLAGSGVAGAVNGTGTAASFSNPLGIAVDKSSNVFVADANNSVIRKITPSGVVTTFAGSGVYGFVNGTGVNASFSNPQGIAVDKSGNVYVADTYNYVIRKITAAGVVTTLAGSGGYGAANGTTTAASFGAVYNLAVDGSGNIYAADINNYLVRKITAAGVVTTLAGSGSPGFADGAGVKASFSGNFFLTADAGNNIYVGDAGNNLIRKINTAGLVSTIAGNGGAALINGIGSNASFKSPGNLAIDNNGNLFVADAGNNVLRKVMVAGYAVNMPPPPGLTFDGAAGIFSGTPSAPSPATAYTVSAYNSAGAAATNVNITVVYPPVVKTSAPVTAFASMGDIPPVPVVIDNAILVTDLSKTTLASATVAVTANLTPAQDLLGFNANSASMGNIAGVYNSATGILSLSSAGATATLLQWQAALTSITYSNSNNVNPVTASRTVSFTLNDGLITSSAANKTISLAYTPSSNANLSALTINSATLSPVFAQGTIAYTANVQNAVSSITVKPITASGNATVTVNGTLVASGSNSAAVPLSVGVNTISVVVKAQNLATTKTYTITLTRAATQTITLAALSTQKYGKTDFSVGGSSTNNTIPITYTSSNTAVATITSSGTLHIVGTGTSNITASQAGNVTYDPAPSVTQAITITAADLTVTAGNKTRSYGTANPTLNVTYSGFVNGETSAVVSTQPSISTTASASSPAGSYPITANGAVAPNYIITYVAGTLTITPAVLTVTADNKTKTYGAANPALTVTYSGFVNGDTQTVLTTQATASTTAITSSTVGSYAVSASGASSASYTINYVSGTLTVTKAVLTITADNKSKGYGSVNPALTASYSGFVNGDASSSLSTAPVLSTTATTTSAAGSYPITLSGATSNNYTINYVQGALNVIAVPITFNPIAAKTYGTADFSPAATSASAITYTSSNTLVATITGGNIHIKGPGTSTISALSGGSTATQTLTVTPAALTITANNQTKAYGAAIPALTASYSGFVNGETNAVLTTQPAITTTATASSAAGTYPVTASGAAAANYTISYVAGTLTVTAAPLVFSAIPAKPYGTADFAPGATSTAAITYTSGTPAVATIVAGKIHIVQTGTSVITATDGITTLTQTLTVAKAALTITAANKTKIYGAPNPALTVTYTGFVNAETQTALSTQASVTTTATTASPVGSYPITASGAAATNYNITYAAGTMTVGKAALTITANNQSKAYGAAIPALTASYSGFVNSETNAVLTTQPAITTTATASSAAGTYPVTASGAVAANYSISYVAGTLTVTAAPLVFSAIPAKPYGTADFAPGATSTAAITYTSGTTAVATIVAGKIHIVQTGTSVITATDGVTTLTQTLTVAKAALTITAANKTKTYGAANPALTLTYTGFVNAETQTALSTQASVTTTATTASPVGSYPITASGAAATNYSITYAAGTMTVGKAALTITANNQSKAYGAAIPALTASYSGFVNGETNAVLITQPAITTTATASSAAGAYPVTANGAVAANYIISYVAGTLTVTAAPLVFSAIPAKPYGTADFAPGATSTAAITYTSGTQAVATIVAGKIHIVKTGTSVITATDGVTTLTQTLTVAKAALTITATGKTKTYGAANPALTLAYTGFVNAETQTALSTQASVTTTATTASPAGSYPITASGAAATNYSITYAAGTMTVGKAALTITANNQSKAYGAAIPALTASYSGLVNSETNAVLTTQPAVTTTATASSAAGTYPITASGAVAANYTISYVAGTLTIAKAALTIAAANKTKIYGAANPALTVTYAGFVNAETQAALTTLPSVTTTATTSSAAGSYPITASGAVAANYNIIYVAGTLTVILPLQAPAIAYSSPQTYTVGTAIATLIPSNTGGAVPATSYGQVSTFAGSGVAGAVNGTGTAASFTSPEGLAIDKAGNIYVADDGSGLIRKITPAGVVTSVANGTVFPDPNGVAVDASGNLYVPDDEHALIKKITTAGVITTFAGSGSFGLVDGTGTAASFETPYGITIDDAGNLYVADVGSNAIRKITAAGVVTTLAGSGAAGFVNATGKSASFKTPLAATADHLGNIYVADLGNNVVRKITSAGVVTTFAGSGLQGTADGLGTAASFKGSYGLTTDAQNNVYVADAGGNTIRKITPAGLVTTIAGNGIAGTANGIGAAASFSFPAGLIFDAAGNLYVSDLNNNLVRKISMTGYSISPALPAGLVFDSTTGRISGTPSSITPATNYTITAYNSAGTSVATVSIAVSNPFAFAAIAAKTYGTVDFSPGATGTGTISYSSGNTAVATIVSSKIHIKGVGTSVISAVNNGVTLTQTLTVSKAPLTITARNQTKVAGAINPLLTVTYSGFVYSDSSSVVTTAPTVTTTAVTASPAGNYPITASGAVAANYSITYVAGVLSVTVKSLALYEPVSTNNAATNQAKGLPQQPEVKPGMSPNGDGIADVLIVDNISNYPDNKLMLMNRSGVKIYEASGYDNLTRAFDGHSNNNGKMQPAGTYFYVLEYRDKGELKRKTGYFIIKY